MVWLLALMLIGGSGLPGDVPLVEAVRQRNVELVRSLLQKRVDVNAAEGDGATALHWAAYRDDVDLVDMLLRAGARVNVTNDLQITPLALAAANGNGEIVDKLLQAGADADAASETGVTPLMEAARSGSVRAVQALLSHEADVKAHETARGQTALMWAVAQKHPEVVKVLLEHGADVRARSGVRALSVMLDTGGRRVKTAMEDATTIQAGGSTPLIFAAQSGDVESARLLLKAGANPNDTAADGNSALTLAAFSGNGEVARLLLDSGANPNAGESGHTALHAAVLRSDLVTVQALLAKGANPDAQITKGSPVRRFGSQWTLPNTIIGATPLFVAATYLEVDILRALIAAGANVSLALPNGTTPLLAAAGTAVQRQTRPSDIANAGIPDSDSPVVPRDEQTVVEAVRMLLDAGANVNQVSETGDSAMHAAAGSGMVSLIQLLYDRGAQLSLKNRQGQTPLSLTSGGGGRGGNRQLSPELQKAQELLKKLGATN